MTSIQYVHRLISLHTFCQKRYFLNQNLGNATKLKLAQNFNHHKKYHCRYQINLYHAFNKQLLI